MALPFSTSQQPLSSIECTEKRQLINELCKFQPKEILAQDASLRQKQELFEEIQAQNCMNPKEHDFPL